MCERSPTQQWADFPNFVSCLGGAHLLLYHSHRPFFHPHIFFLNYASPVRTLSYQVKLHEKYVKILVLRIIYVFSASLPPFTAYCYRRNTVYPSSFNPPILIILLKSRMFSTRSNIWLLKYSPDKTVSCKEKKRQKKDVLSNFEQIFLWKCENSRS